MASTGTVSVNVIANYGPAIRSGQRASRQIQSQFNRLNFTPRQFEQSLGRITGRASEFQKSMDAATARVFAFGATAAVLNTVTQSFKRMVDATVQVEKSLVEIKSILGSTDRVMNEFRRTIFETAKQTGQDFRTVADGAAELARQGLNAAESAKRLQAALILTRISGLDSVDSVKALTAAINGYTKSTLTAEQIVNKLVAVDTKFAVSAKDLADGFQRAGSTAQDAGVEFDELLGIITAVEQTTARGGAVIGNALKSIFTRVNRSTTIDELKELGVQIDASQSGIDKLRALSNALESISDPLVRNRIKEIAGGVYQINIVSAALRDLGQKNSEFARATEISSKATTEAFQKNAELAATFASRINELIVGVTDLGNKFGQLTIGPALDLILTTANKITTVLSDALDPETGSKAIQLLFSGIAKFIQGPGLLIISGAFLRVLSLVKRFAQDGLKEIFKLTASSQSVADIEAHIITLLQKDENLRGIIYNQSASTEQKHRAIRTAIQQENQLLDYQRNITAGIAENLYRAGIVGIKDHRAVDKRGRSTAGRAAGHIPNNISANNYSLPDYGIPYFEGNDVAKEKRQARALGARGPLKVYLSKGDTTIGGQPFLFNSQEIVIPNVGANGDAAVIPKYKKPPAYNRKVDKLYAEGTSIVNPDYRSVHNAEKFAQLVGLENLSSYEGHRSSIVLEFANNNKRSLVDEIFESQPARKGIRLKYSDPSLTNRVDYGLLKEHWGLENQGQAKTVDQLKVLAYKEAALLNAGETSRSVKGRFVLSPDYKGGTVSPTELAEIQQYSLSGEAASNFSKLAGQSINRANILNQGSSKSAERFTIGSISKYAIAVPTASSLNILSPDSVGGIKGTTDFYDKKNQETKKVDWRFVLANGQKSLQGYYPNLDSEYINQDRNALVDKYRGFVAKAAKSYSDRVFGGNISEDAIVSQMKKGEGLGGAIGSLIGGAFEAAVLSALGVNQRGDFDVPNIASLPKKARELFINSSGQTLFNSPAQHLELKGKGSKPNLNSFIEKVLRAELHGDYSLIEDNIANQKIANFAKGGRLQVNSIRKHGVIIPALQGDFLDSAFGSGVKGSAVFGVGSRRGIPYHAKARAMNLFWPQRRGVDDAAKDFKSSIEQQIVNEATETANLYKVGGIVDKSKVQKIIDSGDGGTQGPIGAGVGAGFESAIISKLKLKGTADQDLSSSNNFDITGSQNLSELRSLVGAYSGVRNFEVKNSPSEGNLQDFVKKVLNYEYKGDWRHAYFDATGVDLSGGGVSTDDRKNRSRLAGRRNAQVGDKSAFQEKSNRYGRRENIQNFAAGYIPPDLKQLEESTAISLGATPNVKAKLTKGKIKGKRRVMNDQETEILNAGPISGDSAIIPNYSFGKFALDQRLRSSAMFDRNTIGRGSAIYDSKERSIIEVPAQFLIDNTHPDFRIDSVTPYHNQSFKGRIKSGKQLSLAEVGPNSFTDPTGVGFINGRNRTAFAAQQGVENIPIAIYNSEINAMRELMQNKGYIPNFARPRQSRPKYNQANQILTTDLLYKAFPHWPKNRGVAPFSFNDFYVGNLASSRHNALLSQTTRSINPSGQVINPRPLVTRVNDIRFAMRRSAGNFIDIHATPIKGKKYSREAGKNLPYPLNNFYHRLAGIQSVRSKNRKHLNDPDFERGYQEQFLSNNSLLRASYTYNSDDIEDFINVYHGAQSLDGPSEAFLAGSKIGRRLGKNSDFFNANPEFRGRTAELRQEFDSFLFPNFAKGHHLPDKGNNFFNTGGGKRDLYRKNFRPPTQADHVNFHELFELDDFQKLAASDREELVKRLGRYADTKNSGLPKLGYHKIEGAGGLLDGLAIDRGLNSAIYNVLNNHKKTIFPNFALPKGFRSSFRMTEDGEDILELFDTKNRNVGFIQHRERDGDIQILSSYLDNTTSNPFTNPKTGKLTRQVRGAGIGKDLYSILLNEAFLTRRNLLSDIEVSQKAARVYRSFAKDGYTVGINTNNKYDNDNGVFDSLDGRPVFHISKYGDLPDDYEPLLEQIKIGNVPNFALLPAMRDRIDQGIDDGFNQTIGPVFFPSDHGKDKIKQSLFDQIGSLPERDQKNLLKNNISFSVLDDAYGKGDSVAGKFNFDTNTISVSRHPSFLHANTIKHTASHEIGHAFDRIYNKRGVDLSHDQVYNYYFNKELKNLLKLAETDFHAKQFLSDNKYFLEDGSYSKGGIKKANREFLAESYAYNNSDKKRDPRFNKYFPKTLKYNNKQFRGGRFRSIFPNFARRITTKGVGRSSLGKSDSSSFDLSRFDVEDELLEAYRLSQKLGYRFPEALEEPAFVRELRRQKVGRILDNANPAQNPYVGDEILDAIYFRSLGKGGGVLSYRGDEIYRDNLGNQKVTLTSTNNLSEQELEELGLGTKVQLTSINNLSNDELAALGDSRRHRNVKLSATSPPIDNIGNTTVNLTSSNNLSREEKIRLGLLKTGKIPLPRKKVEGAGITFHKPPKTFDEDDIFALMDDLAESPEFKIIPAKEKIGKTKRLTREESNFERLIFSGGKKKIDTPLDDILDEFVTPVQAANSPMEKMIQNMNQLGSASEIQRVYDGVGPAMSRIIADQLPIQNVDQLLRITNAEGKRIFSKKQIDQGQVPKKLMGLLTSGGHISSDELRRQISLDNKLSGAANSPKIRHHLGGGKNGTLELSQKVFDPVSGKSFGKKVLSNTLNLNDPNLTVQQLLDQNIPLLNETRAKAIVDELKANGPFKDLNDLQKRTKGIGTKLTERMKQHVDFFAGGYVPNYALTPVSQKQLQSIRDNNAAIRGNRVRGLIDSDVLRKNEDIIRPVLESLGFIKSGEDITNKALSRYNDYLTNSAATKRSEKKINSFKLVTGPVGSGKTTLARGGISGSFAEVLGSKNATKNILLPSDLDDVSEVVSTRTTQPTANRLRNEADFIKELDQIVILATRDDEARAALAERRKYRDTTGVGKEHDKQTTSGASIETATVEGFANRLSKKNRFKVGIVDIRKGFVNKLGRESKIEEAPIAVTIGSFSPFTTGHSELIQDALNKGIAAKNIFLGATATDNIPLDIAKKLRNGETLSDADEHELRGSIFDQKIRLEAIKHSTDPSGINVVSSSVFSKNEGGFGASETPEFIRRNDGSIVMPVRDKSFYVAGSDKLSDSGELTGLPKVFKKDGFKEVIGQRQGGISGTDARKLLLSDDINELALLRILGPAGRDFWLQRNQYGITNLESLQARDRFIRGGVINQDYDKTTSRIKDLQNKIDDINVETGAPLGVDPQGNPTKEPHHTHLDSDGIYKNWGEKSPRRVEYPDEFAEYQAAEKELKRLKDINVNKRVEEWLNSPAGSQYQYAIPNFANPLEDAIKKEVSGTGVKPHQVRIDTHPMLKKFNPLGIGITNTRDQLGGRLTDVHHKDLYAGKHVMPNFADIDPATLHFNSDTGGYIGFDRDSKYLYDTSTNPPKRVTDPKIYQQLGFPTPKGVTQKVVAKQATQQLNNTQQITQPISGSKTTRPISSGGSTPTPSPAPTQRVASGGANTSLLNSPTHPYYQTSNTQLIGNKTVAIGPAIAQANAAATAHQNQFINPNNIEENNPNRGIGGAGLALSLGASFAYPAINPLIQKFNTANKEIETLSSKLERMTFEMSRINKEAEPEEFKKMSQEIKAAQLELKALNKESQNFTTLTSVISSTAIAVLAFADQFIGAFKNFKLPIAGKGLTRAGRGLGVASNRALGGITSSATAARFGGSALATGGAALVATLGLEAFKVNTSAREKTANFEELTVFEKIFGNLGESAGRLERSFDATNGSAQEFSLTLDRALKDVLLGNPLTSELVLGQIQKLLSKNVTGLELEEFNKLKNQITFEAKELDKITKRQLSGENIVSRAILENAGTKSERVVGFEATTNVQENARTLSERVPITSKQLSRLQSQIANLRSLNLDTTRTKSSFRLGRSDNDKLFQAIDPNSANNKLLLEQELSRTLPTDNLKQAVFKIKEQSRLKDIGLDLRKNKIDEDLIASINLPDLEEIDLSKIADNLKKFTKETDIRELLVKNNSRALNKQVNEEISTGENRELLKAQLKERDSLIGATRRIGKGQVDIRKLDSDDISPTELIKLFEKVDFANRLPLGDIRGSIIEDLVKEGLAGIRQAPEVERIKAQRELLSSGGGAVNTIQRLQESRDNITSQIGNGGNIQETFISQIAFDLFLEDLKAATQSGIPVKGLEKFKQDNIEFLTDLTTRNREKILEEKQILELTKQANQSFLKGLADASDTLVSRLNNIRGGVNGYNTSGLNDPFSDKNTGLFNELNLNNESRAKIRSRIASKQVIQFEDAFDKRVDPVTGEVSYGNEALETLRNTANLARKNGPRDRFGRAILSEGTQKQFEKLDFSRFNSAANFFAGDSRAGRISAAARKFDNLGEAKSASDIQAALEAYQTIGREGQAYINRLPKGKVRDDALQKLQELQIAGLDVINQGSLTGSALGFTQATAGSKNDIGKREKSLQRRIKNQKTLNEAVGEEIGDNFKPTTTTREVDPLGKQFEERFTQSLEPLYTQIDDFQKKFSGLNKFIGDSSNSFEDISGVLARVKEELNTISQTLGSKELADAVAQVVAAAANKAGATVENSEDGSTTVTFDPNAQ